MGKKGMIPDVFNPEQLVNLFDACDRPKVGMAIAIAFFCGLRISEACNLRIEDIDLSSKRLKVRDSKYTLRQKSGYGKDRYVPIPNQMVSPIEKWLDIIKGGKWFFPSHNSPDKPLRKKSLGEQFREVLQRANLLKSLYVLEFKQKIKGKKQTKKVTRYKYRFHTLRHSYATYLRNKGVGIDIIKELLGHERYDTTLIYTKISDVQRKEAVNQAFNVQMRQQYIPPEEVKRLSSPSHNQKPLEILQKQMLMGEISEEDYRKKLALLKEANILQLESNQTTS
jgi:integrase/recombinase XerD